MKQTWTVTCGGCGTEGPPGSTTPEALAKAKEAGWSLYRRAGVQVNRPPDYCPACAEKYKRPVCQGFIRKPVPGPCTTTAMYEAESVTGRKLYGCGRHIDDLFRSVFRARPDDPITLRQLRATYHKDD
jgi:hypothetical protein